MNHIYKKPPEEKTSTDETAGNICKNKGGPHPNRTIDAGFKHSRIARV